MYNSTTENMFSGSYRKQKFQIYSLLVNQDNFVSLYYMTVTMAWQFKYYILLM